MLSIMLSKAVTGYGNQAPVAGLNSLCRTRH